MFLSLNDVYCCTTLQGALQWKIIKSFPFLHCRIEAMCSIDMSYPTFQTVFLTLPSFLPIDKISLHSLAFNPHFTCLPAHKPELISKVYPSSLCVCVCTFTFGRIVFWCACMCTRLLLSPHYRFTMPTWYCSPAWSSGASGGLCLHSRGCTLTHVAPTGTFFDTVSPLNSLWHQASGHLYTTSAQRELALIGPRAPERQSGHQSASPPSW